MVARQTAAAGGSAQAAAPTPPSIAPEAAQRLQQLGAVRQALTDEAAAAAAALDRQAARQAELQQQVQQGCADAEQQHEGCAAALAALASHLGCLALGGSGGRERASAPPLLSLDLPDSYARACTRLLELLAGYIQHHNTSGGPADGSSSGPASLAEAQHQRRQAELAQLQGCLCKAERLRVEEEAELARLRAELEVLRSPGTPAAAASLGYSAADLEAEVASLARRRAAHLARATAAAEAAAAAAAGADVVEEQALQRQAAISQRLQAKQQAAAMLARHLARQLLVRQLLLHEQAVVQQVHAVAAAARADAELAVQAATDRLPGYQQAPAAGCSAGAAAGVDAAAAADADAASPGTSPVATATLLLACRAQLQQLLGQLQEEALPAHQEVCARLRGLLFGSPDAAAESGDAGGSSGTAAGPARPQLSPPALQEQLAAVAAAHSSLSLQANALVAEVFDRQQAATSADRQLAERVLVDFWTKPQQLAALEAEQRRKLERFA